MTCYFKNSRMKELFEDIGIEITKENQKEIDNRIHDYLSVDYPNCAAAWKQVRRRLKTDPEGFKQRLAEVLAQYREAA
ncbi:MAG: hypothetical protein ACFFF4_04470 [Candidatus Thorarchaeota archaeon]